MDYKPTGSERDLMGVCFKCGKMGKTKIIDLLDTPGKIVERLREFMISPEDTDGIEANLHDYREVTVCCGSEDYIPEEYAEKCKTCGGWYDERRGKKCRCS